MSYESSISRLPSQLKDLVVNAQVDVGKTDADKAEVAKWIEMVAEGDVVKPAALPVSRLKKLPKSLNESVLLQDLETQLIPRTYIVSNYFTAADVALYGALHPVFVRSFSRYLSMPEAHAKKP
jgi:aminoacyl tRNA synthase complex-interacting multifunctional protein 1